VKKFRFAQGVKTSSKLWYQFLLATLWPWSRLGLKQKWVPRIQGCW